MRLNDLWGRDLHGWRLEEWYELRSADKDGRNVSVGYFNHTFPTKGLFKRKAWHEFYSILVLTNDGKTGFTLSMRNERIALTAVPELPNVISEKLGL